MNRRGYAVWWDEGDGDRHAGRLDLGWLHALFSGNGNGGLAVPLEEITAIECSRGQVLIHRRDQESVRVGNLDAPGALREFAGRLAVRVAVLDRRFGRGRDTRRVADAFPPR
jgi:hypothetical protein